MTCCGMHFQSVSYDYVILSFPYMANFSAAKLLNVFNIRLLKSLRAIISPILPRFDHV